MAVEDYGIMHFPERATLSPGAPRLMTFRGNEVQDHGVALFCGAVLRGAFRMTLPATRSRVMASSSENAPEEQLKGP